MRHIPLRARDGSLRAWALVDDADFEWLNQWTWHLLKKGYVGRDVYPYEHGKRQHHTVRMHRQILGLERGDPRQGDHENRNKLDHRRANLRIAERGDLDNQQNVGIRSDNASGFRGVSWDGKAQKWRAYAKLNGKMRHVGYYETPEQADVAIKAWRAEHMPFSDDRRLAA